jgi:hypothetical protein
MNVRDVYLDLLVIYFDIDDLSIDKEHIKKELNKILKKIEESE